MNESKEIEQTEKSVQSQASNRTSIKTFKGTTTVSTDNNNTIINIKDIIHGFAGKGVNYKKRIIHIIIIADKFRNEVILTLLI